MPADPPPPMPWDGHGLPPQARQRLERAARSNVAGSLLSASEAAALAAVGFSPVGEVMGCIVQQIGWRGYGCDYTFGWNASRTLSSGNAPGWAGLTPYVKAVYHGWHTALRRLVDEAAALGADGVVGIRLTESHLDPNNREFLALGTAVRTEAATAARPFTTELSGTDASLLLHAGWVPTGIAIGIAAAVRHDDYSVRNQASRWQGNTQVDGYTDLVNTVRHDARDQFERRAREHGGEAVMVSDMRLRVWENEPAENHRDHYAEALFMGTTATSFHRGAVAPTRSLSILPLDRTRETAS